MNTKLPNISLNATNNQQINLSSLNNIVVIYIFPKVSNPTEQVIKNWNIIPGAKGCTSQSCSFRDYNKELQQLNATLFGLSIQSISYQNEVKNRLHLPFELLSDQNLRFSKSLNLPTMTIENNIFLKRLTLICKDGIIKKIFYPINNPETNVNDVISYISNKLV